MNRHRALTTGRFKLQHRAGTVCLSLGAVLALATPAWACPVCFAPGDGALADASRLGILVLLAITVAVLGAFAAFFLRLRRLERSVQSRQAPVGDPALPRSETVSC